MEVNKEKRSICPICLKGIPAHIEKTENKTFLVKECDEHGLFKTVIWGQEKPSFEEWNREERAVVLKKAHTSASKGCPFDCGICEAHKQNTCCVLMEVTQRCNLGCPVCFASAGKSTEDLTMDEINHMYDFLMESGGPFNIQLSGGEPTVRDDLDKIISLGKEKGFTFFQLNTNGIRIAEDVEYLERMKNAGLNTVFLQFDGLNDSIYEQIRGRKLLVEKIKCVENCKKVGVGIVLVPTIVKGINDSYIGDILNFAVEQMPYVRGVHFQPISYFGRYPESFKNRITIPEILQEIEKQTNGSMKVENFKPGVSENPRCSFNGNFILSPSGELLAMRKEGTTNESKQNSCCCDSQNDKILPKVIERRGYSCENKEAWESRQYVARQWSAVHKNAEMLRNKETESFDEFIERISQYTLAISCMAFMDAWNFDVDRVRQCYIQVVTKDDRLIPFCAYNLTSESGKTLYR